MAIRRRGQHEKAAPRMAIPRLLRVQGLLFAPLALGYTAACDNFVDRTRATSDDPDPVMGEPDAGDERSDAPDASIHSVDSGLADASSGTVPPIDAGPATDAGPVEEDASGASPDPLPDYTPDLSSIGPASARGAVDGETPPVAFGFGMALEPFAGNPIYAVTLRPTGGSCANAFETMPERTLYFTICSLGVQNVGDACDGPEVTYFIEATAVLAGGIKHKATAGQIRIDAFDPSLGSRIAGDFELTFEHGTLEGEFDTVWCGTTE